MSQPGPGMVLNCLTDCREIKNRLTGEYWYSGKLENMKVRVSSSGLTIEGSLGIFLNGNNIKTISINGIKQAVDKMSDRLGLSFNEANVWRFDIGACIVLERPVREYFNSLGESRYFSRDVFGNGNLQYRNTLRAMVFYDKCLEMKGKRQIIPSEYLGLNVLRYELKYLRRLSTQFGMNIKLFDLLDKDFFIKNVIAWEQQYFHIDRVHKYKTDISNASTKRELMNRLALVGIQSLGGANAVLESLALDRVPGCKGRCQYKRKRNWVKSISENDSCIVPNDCIFELDEKIRLAVEMNIN